jgi:hypothetical protein
MRTLAMPKSSNYVIIKLRNPKQLVQDVQDYD